MRHFDVGLELTTHYVDTNYDTFTLEETVVVTCTDADPGIVDDEPDSCPTNVTTFYYEGVAVTVEDA